MAYRNHGRSIGCTQWKKKKEGRKEMFYLTTHSTHFIYGYIASGIWLRTILIVRKETRCRHIGYSFRLTARVFIRKDRHVLVNDALNTFYFMLCGVGHIATSHSDKERGNPFSLICIKHCEWTLYHGYPLSYISFQPVLHDWCNKGRGMCYPVCGMVHIKEPLLLIDKSSLCDGSGFPFSLSEWSLTI